MLQSKPLKVSPITTADEATEALRLVGERLSRINEEEIELERRIRRMSKVPMSKIRKDEREAMALGRALLTFWNRYGKRLTDGKTLTLAHVGELKERIVESAMHFDDEGAVIKKLRELGEESLIETTERVRIELLEPRLDLRRRIKGIRKGKRTKFYVTPANSPMRLERDPEKNPRMKVVAVKRK